MTRSACTAAAAALAAFFVCGCHGNTILGPLPGTAHPAYTITDLGLGQAHTLSDKGQVVGFFHESTSSSKDDTPYFRCFFWDKGKRTVMVTSSRGWFEADAISTISERGQILGRAAVPRRTLQSLPVEHNYLWQNGKTTDLEADPRFRGMGLMHLTKSGALYAVSKPQSTLDQQHLWFYPAGFGPGSRRDMGVIGGKNVYVSAINDTGQIVGMIVAMPIHHAFLWQDGRLTDMGTLGGKNSKATAINNAGQIVGIADLPQKAADLASASHGFLWEHGKMRDIGTAPGDDNSYASAINSKGEIVGFSGGHPSQSLLWKKGRIIILNQLIPSGTPWVTLFRAQDINTQGQIVGEGLSRTNEQLHGYLLTPIGYKAVKGDDTQWQTQ